MTRSPHRSATRLVALVVALATTLMMSVGLAGNAEAKRSHAPLPVDVTGTLADGTGTVAGVFSITRFAVQGDTINAIGTFTGSITDAAGNTLASGTQALALPLDTAASGAGSAPSTVDSTAVTAAAAAGSCQILDLVLGPLDLDLLGLMVHLDTVHLNITAQQGPGNLLGNLLCAVAGLLDNTGTGGLNGILQSIANLLNQILGALG